VDDKIITNVVAVITELIIYSSLAVNNAVGKR